LYKEHDEIYLKRVSQTPRGYSRKIVTVNFYQQGKLFQREYYTNLV